MKVETRKSTRSSVVLLPAFLAAMAEQPALAVSFAGLGDLPGGAFSSDAAGISADGKVVVGSSMSESGQTAFMWTASSGMVGLGVLGADSGGKLRSYANAVSADGSVVAGGTTSSASVSGTEAFVWSQATGMIGLGMLPGGSTSNATAITADGSAVIGYGSANGYTLESGIWRAGSGWTELGDLAGGQAYSYAWDASANGSVVVGIGNSGNLEAFRWTETGGMAGLGTPASATRSEAFGVSSDGGIVVGDFGTSTGKQAAYWTADEGWVGLGSLGHANSFATDVTDDGTMIVGTAMTYDVSTDTLDSIGLIWDSVNGTKNANEVLTDVYGLDLAGWLITAVTGVTADGSFLVGRGINPDGNQEAWIADLRTTPVPAPAAVWLFGTALPGLLVFGKCRKDSRGINFEGLSRS